MAHYDTLAGPSEASWEGVGLEWFCAPLREAPNPHLENCGLMKRHAVTAVGPHLGSVVD